MISSLSTAYFHHMCSVLKLVIMHLLNQPKVEGMFCQRELISAEFENLRMKPAYLSSGLDLCVLLCGNASKASDFAAIQLQ